MKRFYSPEDFGIYMKKYWNIITGNRIVTLLILFLILIGLCSYYYDNFMDYQEYPGTGTIVTSYPEGEMVAVSGYVPQILPDGFYLVDIYQDKPVIYTIKSDEKVVKGALIQVLGILGPDYQITAHGMKVTEEWSYNFMILRSFIAFLFLAFIFHHYWRFEFKKGEFTRRR